MNGSLRFALPAIASAIVTLLCVAPGEAAAQATPASSSVPGKAPLVASAPAPAPAPTAAGATQAAAASAGPGGWQDAMAGSVLEDYLRSLQVAGIAPASMVAVRAWGPHELARITPADSARHPWSARFAHAGAPGWSPRVSLLRATTQSVWNSSFPFGFNDGAVWAGRGLTQSVSAGVQATWGPLSLQLAPIAFWAQNTSYDLLANGSTGDAAFEDVVRGIDRPQRFGSGSYARVDPGQSTIRLDAFGVAAGFSTANEVWGPGVTHPLVMGTNAAGLPRFFVGTSGPLDLWIGRLDARMMLGRMDASDWAPASPDSGRRLATAMVVSFSPRFAPNFEIGGTRFYQRNWPAGGPSLGDFSILFESFLKKSIGGNAVDDTTFRAPDNQLASAFFRWAMRPAAEVYGELYREDHSADLRDFFVEPEHDLGWMLGFRRVWRGAGDARLTVLRTELVNGRPTHLQAVRPQVHLYSHGRFRNGHTERGQVLGSDALFGGGGGILAVDRYAPGGRVTFAYQRVGRHWRTVGAADESFTARGQDVIHALGGELSRFAGAVEWRAGAQLLVNVNRNFAEDVAGVQVSAGLAWVPGR